MNLIAIDIGNSNINIGLLLKSQEQFVKSIPGTDINKLKKCLKSSWGKIPVAKRSKEGKRDGVIVVSSVKPLWTKVIQNIVKQELGEKILIIGKNIPYPIGMGIKETDKIGADRVICAAAAYAVVERAVVVADFGTAVTIDLVDDRGVFDGGTIFPGFEASAKALKDNTAQLPQVKVSRPTMPFGKNTSDAINCGLYYSAVGALEEIIRRYAEKLGTWPRTVITGRGAEIIKDDCEFIDTYVPNLVIKGIALAYRRWLESKE